MTPKQYKEAKHRVKVAIETQSASEALAIFNEVADQMTEPMASALLRFIFIDHAAGEYAT